LGQINWHIFTHKHKLPSWQEKTERKAFGKHTRSAFCHLAIS